MIDVTRPVEDPLLVAAIRRHAVQRSDESAIEVARQIRSATFLVPFAADELEISPGEEEGKVTIKAGSVLKFLTAYNAEGVPCLPVFIDWAEVAAWSSQEVSVLTMPFSDVHDFVKMSKGYPGIIINPGTFGWSLSKRQLDAVKEDVLT